MPRAASNVCSVTPSRFCTAIANKAYARVYDILGRAQLVAFPEWDENYWSVELPIDVVDSEERKLMLAAAIAQAETELTSMVYHFIGECDKGGCRNGTNHGSRPSKIASSWDF